MAEQEPNAPDPMGPAILRGVAIGIPTVLVGLTLAMWLITPLGLADAIVASLLPGILLGAFGGGFAGMAMTMRE